MWLPVFHFVGLDSRKGASRSLLSFDDCALDVQNMAEHMPVPLHDWGRTRASLTHSLPRLRPHSCAHQGDIDIILRLILQNAVHRLPSSLSIANRIAVQSNTRGRRITQLAKLNIPP